MDNPQAHPFGAASPGCCSQNLCTEAIVCKGNKLIGDFCDQDSECLTEFCSTSEHKCISQERAEKGSIFGGGGDEVDPEEGEGISTEKRNLEIKNVVLVSSIITFVGLAAFFVKCVQRRGSENASGAATL